MRTFYITVTLGTYVEQTDSTTRAVMTIFDEHNGQYHTRVLADTTMLSTKVATKFRQVFPMIGGLHGDAIEFESHPGEAKGVKVYRLECDSPSSSIPSYGERPSGGFV